MADRWYVKSGSGSGSIPEPRNLIIGHVTRPHGIRGEVRVEIHTEQPDRFFMLDSILVGEQELLPMTIESVRFHQKIIILKLGNCDTRNQAERLRDKQLFIPIEEAIPLEEDEYFLYQLMIR